MHNLTMRVPQTNVLQCKLISSWHTERSLSWHHVYWRKYPDNLYNTDLLIQFR